MPDGWQIRGCKQTGRNVGDSDMQKVPGKTKPWSYLTWPNRISMLRLLLVPPFVVIMQHQQSDKLYRYAATGLFSLMALSDVLDGFLARRLHCQTKLGAILDPLADKALMICAAILLSLPHSAVIGNKLPDWVVVMIVGKDMWIITWFVITFMLAGKTWSAPSTSSKLCTAVQAVMIIIILMSPELDRLVHLLGRYLAQVLWWVTAALCILTATSYTRMGLAVMGQPEKESSD